MLMIPLIIDLLLIISITWILVKAMQVQPSNNIVSNIKKEPFLASTQVNFLKQNIPWPLSITAM